MHQTKNDYLDSTLVHTQCACVNGKQNPHVAIVQQEGLLGLYKGVQATSTRAMVVAAAELASYDEVIDLHSKSNP